MLTTREIATLIWIGIFIVLLIAIPRWRRTMGPSTKALIKSALAPQIVIVFGVFVVWCAAWVGLGALLHVWNIGLLKDTIIIVITVGFPLLFRSVNAESGGAILRQITRETVALSALLLFYLNLEPFPLWAEMVGQPILTVAFLLHGFSETKPEWKQLRSCLTVLLSLAILTVIVGTTVQFVINLGQRDWAQTLGELALSIWLPLVMFPYVYASSFYASTEKLVKRMRRYQPPARRRVVFAAVLGLGLSVRWTKAFVPMYEKPVSRAKGFREALRMMSEFRDSVRQESERVEDLRAHTAALAGETGTDGNGAHLDRREFEGSKRALEFVHLCEMGWYARLGNRYWDDRTDLSLRPTDRFNLPDDHGIAVELAPGAQVWRAWRQMPSTSYLAIGGRDGEGHEWIWEGTGRPSTWPGDTDWTNKTFAPELPPDWAYDDEIGI